MGDLNADGSYFDEDSNSDHLDSYDWVIDDTQNTTTKLKKIISLYYIFGFVLAYLRLSQQTSLNLVELAFQSQYHCP